MNFIRFAIMGYNLKKSLITLFLITLILLINIVSSLAVNRETIKRNTDEQDDEWIAKQVNNQKTQFP